MKNCVILLKITLLLISGIVEINAQISSVSDNLVAQPVPDRTVSYCLSDTGISRPIIWGLDLAWLSKENILRGMAYMGAERVDIIRSSFTPTAALVDSELQAAELSELNERLAIIDLVRPGMDIMLNVDALTIDPWYKESVANWVQIIEITAKHHEERGHNVVAVSPLNEPDYVWNGMGTIEDFYNIAGEMKQNPYFDSIRISGGNTLNTDQALIWYNALKDRLDEGNTHQLAGSFSNYASFFQEVRANNHHATNDELHNVMESMVGVEYGMQTGIWWGTAELARGEFVKASDGKRLGYAEHRTKWTAASVYRNPEGKVQAFGGTSERQAVETTYRFVSKDRDVFYDGYGPQREYTMVMPGGTGYNDGQTNAERVVNITWGDDIQPVINGRYVLVNRNSSKVMEVADGATVRGANIQQGTNTGGTYQQWKITPVNSRIGGDFSYFTITSVRSGKVADVYNWSFDNGGNIAVWDVTNASNQHWYLEYIEDGWFYIRSRFSTKCLEVADSSTDAGANIQQSDKDGGTNQQWRFLPVGAKVESDPPSAPDNLVATANAESIRLDWSASSETDVAGYTIFRSDSTGGPYYTIARNVISTSFIDNTTTSGGQFFYVIRAVDSSLNRSAYSNEASATATGDSNIIAWFRFEGNTMDSSVNLNHGATYGKISYNGEDGSKAIEMNGTDAFVQLPANLANQEDITVAAWVYWKGGLIKQRIFDFGNDQDENMYLTPRSSTGHMCFAIKCGDKEQSLEAPVLSTGEWLHVAVTLDTSRAGMYINGELVAESDSFTISPSDFKPMLNYIGRSQNYVPLFKGYIDDFRVYNYALSANEVAQLTEIPHATIIDLVNPDHNSLNSLLVWPVPANDVLFVNYSVKENNNLSMLSMYNANGRLVMCKDINTDETEFNISGLPSGIYILKLTNREETLIKKFIIRH